MEAPQAKYINTLRITLAFTLENVDWARLWENWGMKVSLARRDADSVTYDIVWPIPVFGKTMKLDFTSNGPYFALGEVQFFYTLPSGWSIIIPV